MDAKVQLEFGNLHPFDGEGDPSDFAHSAARGIAAMMQDNPDMAALLDAMDESMRGEFVAGMADIIREAQAAEGESEPAPEVDAEE